MPRGGGSRSSFGGRSSSPPPRSSHPAPQPSFHPPTAQPAQKPSMFSGFGSTMVQGMAFGAGSEVAHQAVRSVMGGSGHSQPAPQQQQQVPQQQYNMSNGGMNQQQEQPCMKENQGFLSCLKSATGDIGSCQYYMDLLKQCESSSQSYMKPQNF